MATRERITFSSLPFLCGVEAVAGQDVSNTFESHSHTTAVVGMVDGGVRVIGHGHGESRILRGGLFFLNPGQVHACASGEEGAHSYRLLSVDPAVLARVASEISEKSVSGVWFSCVHATHEIISRDFERFFRMLSDPLAPALDKESLLYGLLSEIILSFAQDPPEVCAVGRQDAAMARVRDHIRTHHAEPLTLASLAAVACLSPFHLQRLFSRRYGMSPHRYLTHRRVAEARSLLSDGAGIAEAALAAGFSDQSHLTYHFKRVVGTTPGRFVRDNL